MSYISAVLGDSAVAFWLLDEQSGTVAADTFAPGPAGSYVGGPTLGVPSPIATNYAVQTTASSYVSLPKPSTGTNFSLEFVHVYDGGDVVFRDSSTGSAGWRLDLSGTNPVVRMDGVDSPISSVTSASLKTGRHHYVINGFGMVYIDGVRRAWVGGGSSSTIVGPLLFGRDGSGGAYSPGIYSAVAFYNYILVDQPADHFAALDDRELSPVHIVTTVAPIQPDYHALDTVYISTAVAVIPPPPVVHRTRATTTGGIRLASSATATWEPPVDAPPTPLPERIIVAQVIDSVTSSGTQFTPVVRSAQDDFQRYRIVVGGKDVTYFRGVQTPLPEYGLVAPLRYGSGMLSLPQVHAAYERPGHGELSWLKKFAKVKIQRLNSSGGVHATDYLGFVADFEHTGRDFSCVLGGEATGTAAMQDRPVPIFPFTTDIGTQVQRTIQHQLRLPVANEPVTGIEVAETGGGSQLDFLTEVLAKSTQRDGVQWTVEPDASGNYRMQQKDLSTVTASVYIDGFVVSQALTRDFTEEPNRIWAQGVDPDGKRLRFAIFPGLQTTDIAYPGSVLHPGDTGDNVTAIIWRLYTLGWLDEFPPSEWTTAGDDPVTAAVEEVQDDAGLTVNGNVDAATWRAIFRGDDYALRRSQQKPAAQRKFTQAFLRDATGNIIGQNPLYDRSRKVVDASIDVPGFTRRKLQKWAGHEVADPDVSNWVGTITLNGGAVIDGLHNPGDPLVTADVREARSLKPGHNLWLPNWDGGTLVHVSGVNVTGDAVVELTVDSRARDTMKVWEVITRNRASRIRADRQWIAQNRRSGVHDDTGAFYDGGPFGKIERTFCPGNQWTIIKTPGGRSGMLQKISLATDNDEALFAFGIFGTHVGPGRLRSVIGDPLTKDGSKNWQHKQKILTEDMWMVYSAGSVDTDGTRQLCGFWPEVVDPEAVNVVHQTGTANSGTNTITVGGGGYDDGTQVYFSAGSVPAGLTANNNYYVIDSSGSSFKVSAIQGGTAMDISADATGVDVSTRAQAYPAVTGEFRDHAGAAYFCKGSPVLWIAVFPDRDCHVQGGRVLELLLDDTAG